MKLRQLTVSLAVLAAAAVPVAGCGGGSNGGSASGTPAQKAQGGGSAKSKPGSVSIANFKFVPASLTVRKGARISLTNNDSTAHTATSDDGKSFDTGDIDPGSSMAITLPKAGTFKYHCSIHPFMHGTIVVK